MKRAGEAREDVELEAFLVGVEKAEAVVLARAARLSADAMCAAQVGWVLRGAGVEEELAILRAMHRLGATFKEMQKAAEEMKK